MIPLKLTLNNFLCYRDKVPTLNLEGVHVACLCGENGHGKSALMDAITWVLWGKARGKSQDDLIYFGQDDMRVDLEFVAQGGRYLVIRRHSRGGTKRRHGASDLQLQGYSAKGFSPITGNTMRESQALLEKVIGIDYDTFINSAFLLQGRADEFANRTPGERKEVLAKILGLSRYDRLQELAKQSAAICELEASAIQSRIVDRTQELEERDELQQELNGVITVLKSVNKRLQGSRQQVELLRRHVDDLQRYTVQKQDLKRTINTAEQELRQLNKQIAALQDRIINYEAVLVNKEHVEVNYQRLQESRKRQQVLSKALQKINQLSNYRSPLIQKLNNDKTRLEERRNSLMNIIQTQLLPRVQSIPDLRGRLHEAQEYQSELSGQQEKTLTEIRLRLQELDNNIGRYRALAKQLQQEGQELRSKLMLLDAEHSDISCPLCETELGSEGCQNLVLNYNVQIKEKRIQYTQSAQSLQSAELEKDELEGQLFEQEKILNRALQETHENFTSLKRELEECLKSEETLREAEFEKERLEKSLSKETYAQKERGLLRELDDELDFIDFDPDSLKQLDREVRQLQPNEEKYRNLQEAIKNMPLQKQDLLQAQALAKRREKEIDSSRRHLQQLLKEIAQLPSQEDSLADLELDCDSLNNQQSEQLSLKGDLEGKLNRLKAIHDQLIDLEIKYSKLRENQGLYQELAEAFGRRGIQAMLIETVLPRLEDKANDLLARMTDGRMHLRLETQRETRKGDVRETLDILISDELGDRSYEMFSGGESYRINLALRIALSKVLAERTGLPSLPTLFIDEGFGTQDVAGREKILDVIRAIEPDFQKIIVITHLEDIKDAFPVRIEVQKTSYGSTLRMT